MTAPRILSAPYRPQPLQLTAAGKHAQRLVERRRRTVCAALWPAFLLGVANMALFTRLWLPEIRGLPILDPLIDQIEPVAAWPLLAVGRVQDAPSGGAAASFALVTSILLAICIDRGGLWRYAVPPLAGLLLLASLLALPEAFAGFPAHLGAVFILLPCAAFAGSLLVTWWRARRSGAPDPFGRPVSNPGSAATTALVIFGLCVLAPIATGRALFASEVREQTVRIIDSGSSMGPLMLFSSATLLCYLGGFAVAFAARMALALLPPYIFPMLSVPAAVPPYAWPQQRLRRRTTAPAVAGAITIVVTVALIAPAAAAAGERLIESSRSDAPAGWGCMRWSSEQHPDRFLLGADGCTRVDSYLGYERTGSSEEAAEQSVEAQTPEGDPITQTPIAAVYDPVLVLVTSTRTDGRADAVAGYRFEDASVVWRFGCPGGEPLTVRLAGTGQEQAVAGRQTLPDEGEAVMIGCQDAVYRLNPRTGAPV